MKRQRKKVTANDNDPVLLMRGVGKEIWTDISGDAFVADLRAGRFSAQPPTQRKLTKIRRRKSEV